MTADQLELMVARTGSEQLRHTVSDANPHAAVREWTREWVRNMAAMPDWPPPDPDEEARRSRRPPSLARKIANLAWTLRAWAKDRFRFVRRREFNRRRRICQACPKLKGDACGLCGCNMKVKPWLKAARCPDDPPRW